MRRFPLLLLLVCAVATLGVAGCGVDDDGGGTTAATTTETTDTSTTEGGGGAASVIKVSADPGGDLAFQQDSLTGKAGKNKIEFTNDASIPHDVKIERDGEEVGGTDVVTGGTADTTVTLEAGDYTFFCSVPGHRQAGMEGQLTVK
jgi:plastocyanin